jgi:hypothetical protein
MKLNKLFYVLLVILILPSLSSAQEQSQWKDSFDRGAPIGVYFRWCKVTNTCGND